MTAHEDLATLNLALESLAPDRAEEYRAAFELAAVYGPELVAIRNVLEAGRGIGLALDGVQTAADDIAAAKRHLSYPWVLDADPDSGEPTLAHAAARPILALARRRMGGR